MAQYRHIRVKPVTPAIGAEIEGIDLNALTDAAFEEIRQAFLEHLVIFFPGQPIRPENQLALAERFGGVADAHPTHDVHPDCPKVNIFKSDPHMRPATDEWHADTTFRKAIPLGAVLRAVTLPPLGGDTLWASMYAAYDALSDEMKARIETLDAAHVLFNANSPASPRIEREIMASGNPVQIQRLEVAKATPPTIHPVVCVHPVTGRRLLFINAIYTQHIIGMGESESHALLQTLFMHIMRPDFQVRLRWQRDTVVIWDNRSTQHYATSDYWPQERVMYRAAIEGWEPVTARAMQGATFIAAERSA